MPSLSRSRSLSTPASATPASASAAEEVPRRLPPLLRRAWYGLNQCFRQRIAHLEITPDQYSILRWLSEGDPKGLTQRALTNLMTSDPNTITSTLSRMESAGLIARQTHELDKRAHRVRLLAAGTRVFENAKLVAQGLEAQLLAALPAARRERFLKDLEFLADACTGASERASKKRVKAQGVSRMPGE